MLWEKTSRKLLNIFFYLFVWGTDDIVNTDLIPPAKSDF